MAFRAHVEARVPLAETVDFRGAPHVDTVRYYNSDTLGRTRRGGRINLKIAAGAAVVAVPSIVVDVVDNIQALGLVAGASGGLALALGIYGIRMLWNARRLERAIQEKDPIEVLAEMKRYS